MEDRQLISGRMLAGWLVDTLATANLAQIGFLLQLLGERLPEMGRHASIARLCVRVACAKLVEVSATIRVGLTDERSARVQPQLQWLGLKACSSKSLWYVVIAWQTLR